MLDSVVRSLSLPLRASLPSAQTCNYKHSTPARADQRDSHSPIHTHIYLHTLSHTLMQSKSSAPHTKGSQVEIFC